MNRQFVRLMRTKLTDALSQVDTTMQSRVVESRYDAGMNKIWFRVEFGTDEEPPFVRDFRTLAPLNGLKVDTLGKVFIASWGERYRIVGWNRKARKFPVVVNRVRDEKQYVLKLADVLNASFEEAT